MILDLFAGPRGWSEGLRELGLSDVGIEWDAAACETAAAAGHATIRADVAAYPTEPFVGKVEGLIASPPCPDFSMNGRRAGREGTSGQLIDQVPRWIGATRPRWFACEQVPPALEVWQEFAGLFRSWGYSTWAGVLNAADYGVPQTRRRAILVGSLDRVAGPPPATHAEIPTPSFFGELLPWVSMAEALEIPPDLLLHTSASVNRVDEDGRRVPQRVATRRPAPTVDCKAGRSSWVLLDTRRDKREDGSTQTRSVDLPAPTLSTVPGQWQWVDGVGHRRNVTRPELARLQTFRDGYPWRGGGEQGV